MNNLIFYVKDQIHFKTNHTSQTAHDFLSITFLGSYNVIPVLCEQNE